MLVKLDKATWYPTGVFPRTVKVPKRRKRGGKGCTISISGKVLQEAHVDLSRDLYGRWVVKKDVMLEVSYERKEGAYKLMRMNSFWSRAVYPPRTVRDVLGGKHCVWEVCKEMTLRLMPVSVRLRLLEYVGSSLAAPDHIELHTDAEIIHSLNCKHVLVGVSNGLLVLVPEKLGIPVDPVETSGIGAAVRITTPVRKTMQRKSIPFGTEGTCWVGELQIEQPGVSKVKRCIAAVFDHFGGDIGD